MAVVTTNLATQVQNRINTLTGSETLEDLLIIRKAADNLSLNLTAIESAISTKIAQLSGASGSEELLMSNRAAGLVPANQSVIKSIQSGIATSDSAGEVIVEISAVDRSKSFGISTNTSQGGTVFRFLSDNTILLKSIGVRDVYWQVIEYV